MTTWARLVRSLLLLPLLCLLGACWTSERPLIDAGRAARLPIEGTYRSDDPTETETIRITAADDGGYVFDDGGEDGARLLLAPLRDRWAVMQWQLGRPGEKGDEGYLYTLMQLGDDRLVLHGAPCDASLDGIAGIERKGSTCTFTSFTALERAARKAIRRIESGKSEDEPAVMLRQR